jgi:hypothetical protein
MAVDDVYPRRNLPGTAEDWGRALETDVVGTKKALEIVGQNIGAQNRATAASLQELSRQLTAISDAQTAIENAQANIVSTQDFLLNQTQYGQNSATYSATAPSAGIISLYSYDGTYDVSLSVTTSSTGKLSITVGSVVLGLDTAGVGVEIVGVSTPDYFSSVFVSNGVLSASRTFQTTLSGNTSYTVRTRRWYLGSGGGSVSYQSQALSVTKVGQ